MKTVSISCNCGCGKTITNWSESTWFELSQAPFPQSGSGAKLKGTLHFYSLECVLKWTTKAIDVLPGLQEEARTLHPRRGELYSEEVPELFV